MLTLSWIGLYILLILFFNINNVWLIPLDILAFLFLGASNVGGLILGLIVASEEKEKDQWRTVKTNTRFFYFMSAQPLYRVAYNAFKWLSQPVA